MERYLSLDLMEGKVYCPDPRFKKKVIKSEVCIFCDKYIEETTG